MRPEYDWQLGARTLHLGRRTLVMGIVNITPDSFSDGGRFLSPEAAIDHALGMLEEGADIIDIGGESTRPGARVAPLAPENPEPGFHVEHRRAVPPPAVSTEEELHRVLPVIREVKRTAPNAIISIDTYKAEVVRQAVDAGAEVVNDVSALRWDDAMRSTVATMNCGIILMHTRGRPEQWRTLPPLPDPVALVSRELGEWAAETVCAGIARERIVLDPGFGFGKSLEENYPLLAHFDEFHKLGFPLLSATSRKSFIGKTIARHGEEPVPPQQRLYGTLATLTASILKGAHIVRVHDVTPALEVAAVADAILNAI
jgi:dihydropteroate synthase